MIDRTFRLRLTGKDTRTIYCERYYADMDSAMKDLTDICIRYKQVTEDLFDKQYTMTIEERVEHPESIEYCTARLETLSKKVKNIK